MSATIAIQGNFWSAERNENASRSALKHATSLLKEVGGAVTSYQTIEKTLKLAAHFFRSVGNKASFTCDRLANKLFTVYSGLCLTRVVDTVSKAFNTIFRPIPKRDLRDHTDALNTIGDAVETLGYSAAFVGNPVGLAVAGAAGLSNTFTDIYVKGADIKKTNSLLREVGDAEEARPVKKMLEDTRKYNLLKVAKSVASLATTVLGAALLALGGPAIPAVALLSVGLGATILGIVAHFFKETAPYQLADFSKPVVPASTSNSSSASV